MHHWEWMQIGTILIWMVYFWIWDRPVRFGRNTEHGYYTAVLCKKVRSGWTTDQVLKTTELDVKDVDGYVSEWVSQSVSQSVNQSIGQSVSSTAFLTLSSTAFLTLYDPYWHHSSQHAILDMMVLTHCPMEDLDFKNVVFSFVLLIGIFRSFYANELHGILLMIS